MRVWGLVFVTFVATACSAQVAAPTSGVSDIAVDSTRLIADIRYLASPELAGRRVGTPGNAAARGYIQAAFVAAGLSSFDGGLLHEFRAGDVTGVNVVGFVRGSERPGAYIVVTAHYDHLGAPDGVIFHGADDNASGTAALLEIARQIALRPARHSVVFVALDAEEGGLRGARAFVADPPVPLDSILINVNMDMVSRNVDDEIYVAGAYHYPQLESPITTVAGRSSLDVLLGHDRPDLPAADDWTSQSDHAAFHDVGIPFVYFGVEDHPDYHRPTDTFERIDPGFFVQAATTVLDFVREIDRTMPESGR